MEKIKERVRGRPKEKQRQQTNEELPEVSEGDVFSTIKEWESLYPHTYGDEILKDILKGKSK
jgi:hypothetical protein